MGAVTVKGFGSDLFIALIPQRLMNLYDFQPQIPSSLLNNVWMITGFLP